MVPQCCFIISVGCGNISGCCGTISERCGNVSERCGIISVNSEPYFAPCGPVSDGCSPIFTRGRVCTHFFVSKERFYLFVEIISLRKCRTEIIKNLFWNVKIIVNRSRAINDLQYLKFGLIIIFSDD